MAYNLDTKVEKMMVIFFALNIKQKSWNKRYALAAYTAIQCSMAEAKGSARKTVVQLNWVSEVERDLTPAHFHWVVVIARAAAARTAAPRPWRGRGLGEGSAAHGGGSRNFGGNANAIGVLSPKGRKWQMAEDPLNIRVWNRLAELLKMTN